MTQEQVIGLITKGKIDQALTAVARKNSPAVRMLQAEYQSMKRDARMGMLEYSKERFVLNQITKTLSN